MCRRWRWRWRKWKRSGRVGGGRRAEDEEKGGNFLGVGFVFLDDECFIETCWFGGVL